MKSFASWNRERKTPLPALKHSLPIFVRLGDYRKPSLGQRWLSTLRRATMSLRKRQKILYWNIVESMWKGHAMWFGRRRNKVSACLSI